MQIVFVGADSKKIECYQVTDGNTPLVNLLFKLHMYNENLPAWGY